VAAKDTWGTWWGKFHLSDIAASALSTISVRLTWVDRYTTETGFTVERSSSDQGPFTAIATEPPGTTSHIDNGLTEATRYYYRVLVNQGIATLGPDNTVTLPAAPDNLVATKTAAYSIRLTWRDNSRGEKGYKVERGLPTTGFAVVANLPDNTTSYIDSGLPGSTTFQYRVVAYTDGGDSLPSNVASATTDPAPSGGGGGCAAVAPYGGSTADASSILSLLVLFLPAAVYGWKRHCPC
jgi:titin